MVHELEMPLADARLEIDRHEALAEQIVAGTMPAVEVGRRRLDRQIHQTRLRVRRDLRPNARVPVERPRILFPRVVAELAWPRNRVELPDLLSGPDIERAGEALRVVVRDDGEAFLEGRADEHHVADDCWSRVHPDLTLLEIDLRAGSEDGAFLQIQDAVAAEALDRRAGLRVQLDEA